MSLPPLTEQQTKVLAFLQRHIEQNGRPPTQSEIADRFKLKNDDYSAILVKALADQSHMLAINAEKIVLTGKKEEEKVYRHHSLYPGGLKSKSARFVRAEKPESMIEEAVWGMLPKNNLGRLMRRKLKVYAGAEHPHSALSPQTLELGARR